ncbi:hypothetical protein FNQ90_24495 [Streptomyces alkaliphilus]|uniref:Uncharacterized protein n=1 Tax=Streptomyces alkaliphilus TaxID=1472722 RepID=A0A7W3Y491_9ACTN|nr:hypothetical protein [Streptomyces alkaliphilus]MBB0247195.1 hypothetical protein [Streptomyces alkaliphilus]
MSTMVRTTPRALMERRRRLLADIHMGYEELRTRAFTYSLTAEELAVWHAVQDIDRLLNCDGWYIRVEDRDLYAVA